jgi:hypothetical protein
LELKINKSTPKSMLLNPGQVYRVFKKTIFIFSIFFFLITDLANAQNPIKDPSSPDVPELPKTQLPPADLYNFG